MSGLGAGLGIQPTRITHDQIVPNIALATPFGVSGNVTSDITLDPQENTVAVDATSGAVAVTLPSFDEAYQEVVVSKRDASANAVTVTAAGSDTINGAGTLALTTQYDSARLRPGPTEWMAV